MDTLTQIQAMLEKQGMTVELIRLDADPEYEHPAALLVIRNAVSHWVDYTELLREQESLTPDTKAKMRGRVVNKRARYNLCFADDEQFPDYESGQGRVVSFATQPQLQPVTFHPPIHITAR